MRIVIDGLDEKTTQEWLKSQGSKDTIRQGTAQPDRVEIPFGVIQIGKVDPRARGRDIQAQLLMNYRGPFRLSLERTGKDLLSSDEITYGGVHQRLTAIEQILWALIPTTKRQLLQKKVKGLLPVGPEDKPKKAKKGSAKSGKQPKAKPAKKSKKAKKEQPASEDLYTQAVEGGGL